MRLCLVHGFTQTGASWDRIAVELRARGHDVLTPDVPGHGGASAVRADLWEGARMLADSIGPAVWVGYSLGGRLVLHVALAYPAVAERIVLVSTTAGIDDEQERAARRRDDDALAREVERDGVDAFVERWLDGPLWVTLPRGRAGVEHRRANTAGGLASSLRLAGTGTQEPLWDRLPTIAAPALIITGSHDRRFDLIGDRMAAAIPHATHTTIASAGHAAPWEQPEAFVSAVDGWLSQ